MVRQLVLFSFFITVTFISIGNAASPIGKWRGHWESGASGHRGALNARIRQVDSRSYRAVFTGRFAVVIPFFYRSDLTRVPGTQNRFQSSKRLPLLGEYRMTASVVGNQFRARFGSGKDAGIFKMSRR